MSQPADFVLRNITIYDGSGLAPWRGDLAVTGDRISAVTSADAQDTLNGNAVLEMGGWAVAPGFIDAHTHDDRIVLDDYQAKWWTAWNALTRRKSNGGIVMVRRKLQESESIEMSRARLREFLSDVIGVSRDYLAG